MRLRYSVMLILILTLIIPSQSLFSASSHPLQQAFAQTQSVTFSMYNFGTNPSYCTPTTANYNAAQPSGTSTLSTNDGVTYSLHIQIKNAVASAPYQIDERCVYTITSTGITADGSGNIDTTISIGASTANAILSGQHLIDLGILSGSGPGGAGNTFISGPLITATPPTVSVTTPTNGATFSSGTVTITGTASSSYTIISNVQVSIDGAPYVAATGTTSWSYTANGLANGLHSITAKATDSQGLIGYSTNVVASSGVPVGNGGQELAFDPDNGNIYVSNYNPSYNVVVVSGSTNQVLATIADSGGPTGIAYDSVNHYIYTANYNTGSVTMINTANNQVVGSIPVGANPFGVAYVPNGNIYVANTGSNTVSVINPSTNTVVGTISAGAHPQDFTYDSTHNLLYMTNQGSNNVSVINPSTNTVVNTINVGNSPRGLAYDPANGKIYVANYGSNTVSIINTSTNTVLATIPTGSSGGPNGVAFDPVNGFVYVPDFSSTTNRLNVIDTSTNTFINPVTLPSASYYYYAIFDPVNSDIYITSGSNVAIIQTQTQFTVTVQDTTAPVVTVPSSITVPPTSPSGAVVTFTTSAQDPDDAAGPVQCNHASGSTFPIGTTTVTCTSTDTHSNTGTASFTVTVQTPLQALQSLIAVKENMGLPHGTTTSLDAKLTAASNSLSSGDGQTAKNQLNAFISEVNAQTEKKITQVQANQLISGAQNIINSIQ